MNLLINYIDRMKDTIYFKHDFNSHLDPKMTKLIIKLWYEWYGLYWVLLEYMRNDTDVSLSYNDRNTFAYTARYNENKLDDFLKVCVDIELLIYDNEDMVYYSKRLQEDVAHMKMKSKQARDAINKRWGNRDKRAKELKNKGVNTDVYTDVIPNSIVEDSINTIVEDSISIPTETATFVPVTKIVERFITLQGERLPSVKKQMQKKDYLNKQQKSYDMMLWDLKKEWIDISIAPMILKYVLEDEFWCNQIQSITKLRKKNRDWIKYWLVMVEKMHIENEKAKEKVIWF